MEIDQVCMKEMSVSEPSMRYRKTLRPHQNQRPHSSLGQDQRLPDYWLIGVRYRDGMTFIQALIWNLRDQYSTNGQAHNEESTS